MEPLLRDTRKLRDKIELTVDPRQIALVVIGEVLLLVLVFILGFAVGHSRHTKPKAEIAQQKAQIPGAEEILKQTAEQTISQAEAVTEEASAQQDEQALQQAWQQTAEPSTGQPVYHIDLTDQKASQAPMVPAVEPSQTSSGEEKNLIVEVPPLEESELLAEETAQTPVQVQQPQVHIEVPTTKSNRYYTIQVAAFDAQTLAQAYIDKLKTKYALDAYMVEGSVQGKKWYRVRVGKFEDLDKAKEFAKVLEEKLQVKPFIDLTSE